MERVVEREMASDANYRKRAEGRPLRRDATPLTDEELLAKLRSFGIEIDRQSLERLCGEALSAEEICTPLLERATFRDRHQRMDQDWIWICVHALWQRWFPDRPSFEALDDQIQAGYELQSSGDEVVVCETWLNAWAMVLRLFDRGGMRSIKEFDERFGGSQSLFNWNQDLEDALGNAGQEDSRFLTARVALCEECLRRFPDDDALTIENRRRALADSHFQLGETSKAVGLYRDWLKADPCWGWGWIGWSDLYRFTRQERQDLSRSEQILREGLATEGVRDSADIADRLAELFKEQGRGEEEAAEFFRRVEASAAAVKVSRTIGAEGSVLREKTKVQFGGGGLPLHQLPALRAGLLKAPAPAAVVRQKVGRNEPCPCGSGKKFKKCCGA